MDYIKQKLALVPNKPGCYQMKNKDGIIIYVGKAKKLKNRLSSYFRGTHTGKTKKLVSEISDFEYIVVENETESLVLELNLIKKYDPKYNILLRDDKSYPYIELTNEEIPKLSVVRNVNRKRSNRTRLFGPYPNVTAARTIVNLLNRICPLRKCNTYNKKPCLYYHIGQCLGYCSKTYDKEELKNMESEILSFLRGNDKILTDKIKIAMNDASNKLNFEKAKELEKQGKLVRPYIPEYAKHNAHMYYIILPTEQKRNITYTYEKVKNNEFYDIEFSVKGLKKGDKIFLGNYDSDNKKYLQQFNIISNTENPNARFVFNDISKNARIDILIKDEKDNILISESVNIDIDIFEDLKNGNINDFFTYVKNFINNKINKPIKNIMNSFQLLFNRLDVDLQIGIVIIFLIMIIFGIFRFLMKG